MNDIYVNLDQVVKNIDNGGLLVGNNAEWAKEAVYNAPYINLDYYVPCMDIEEVKKQCQEKLTQYAALGSIAKVECYVEFMQMLNSLWIDPEDRR